MNVLKPHLQTTVFTLLEAGTSQREIGRVSGIDSKTIRAYQQRWLVQRANYPGVAAGTEPQMPAPRPPAMAQPTSSACEVHREFIAAHLRLKL